MIKSEKHKSGAASELLAAAYYINQGYIVSKPIIEGYEYDMIVDMKGCLSRVQTKTIYFDNSKKRYMFSCATSKVRSGKKTTNKKYTKDSFEFLCAVCLFPRAIYVFPVDIVEGKRSITLYPDGINNKTRKICEFEKFRVE